MPSNEANTGAQPGVGPKLKGNFEGQKPTSKSIAPRIGPYTVTTSQSNKRGPQG